MTSLATSMPATGQRQPAALVRRSSPRRRRARASSPYGPRRRRRIGAKRSRSTPFDQRRPVNSASSTRSSRCQRAALGRTIDYAGVEPLDVLVGPATFCHRTPAARRVRAAAESEPLPVVPVLQVVPRRAVRAARRSRSRTARIRPRRAAPSPPDTSRPHHRRAPATSRRAPCPPQRRVRIDLQEIQRRVLRAELDRARRPMQPLGHPLLREPHHQVEADVVEPGRARLAARRRARARRCAPAQPPQLVIVERLHAEAHAVDAGRAESLEPLAADGLGVGLERDFGVGGRGRTRPGTPRMPADLGRLEQRRRPAAEIDGVDGGVRPLGRRINLLRRARRRTGPSARGSNRPRLKLQ